MSFSSGKDSAFALHVARREGELEVVGLLTTVTANFQRVSMHAVRRALLEAQAERLGLPLHVVEIPAPCSNDIYRERMSAAVERMKAEEVEVCIFGDLFLEDVRAYRERMLAGTGIAPSFPLWGRDTRQLAGEMLEAGVVAHLTCVDPRQIDRRFAGRRWDETLLAELPESADPCGERGEFHTFVSHAPGFSSPIPIALGEIVERDGFVFADVSPMPSASP